MSIDDRVKAIEMDVARAIGSVKAVPGTTISRVLAAESGVQWCVAIGAMQAPKAFFYGDTIDEALLAAETFLANMLASK